MKTIKGKIEFVGIPIPKDASNERIYMEGTVFVDTPEKRAIICGNVSEFGDCAILCKLSEITEEQAAEFVDGYGIMYKYYGDNSDKRVMCTAKQSLISLLKANGILCKSMNTVTPIDIVNAHRKGLDITSIPNDLLLIKLT